MQNTKTNLIDKIERGFKLKFISAATGAGKTKWFGVHATERLLSKKNTIIIVPTRVLCDEVEERVKKHAYTNRNQVTAIHSGGKKSTEEQVSGSITRINEYLEQHYLANSTVWMHEDAESGTSSEKRHYKMKAKLGSVLIITEAAYRLLPTWVKAKYLRFWGCLKDEAFEVAHFDRLDLTDSYDEVVANWLRFNIRSEVHGMGMITLNPNRPRTSTDADSLYGSLHTLCEIVGNPDVDLIYDHTSLVESVQLRESTKTKTISIPYCYYDLPSLYGYFEVDSKTGFHNVTFAGAAFEDSILYHMWNKLGVEWMETRTGMPRLMESHRLRMHYWAADEEANWSDYYRNKPQGDSTRGQAYVDFLARRLRNEDFVYLANKSDGLNYSKINGERLPAVSHGLNKWRDHTIFASTGSFLAPTTHEPFYRFLGISVSDIKMMRSIQYVVQALARTNIRVAGSEKIIDVYLPTLNDVLAVMRYLPNAIVCDINKKMDGEITGINATLDPDWAQQVNATPPTERQNDRVVTVAYEGLYDKDVQTLAAESIPKASGIDHHACHLVALRTGIRTDGLTPEEIKSKKPEAMMFAPSVYRKDAPGFLKDYIEYMSDFLLFDFDDSELADEHLEKIFTGFKFQKYTTTSDNKRKKVHSFKVVLPMSRTVSIYEFLRLMGYFGKKITRFGDSLSIETGYDKSCARIHQRQHLPHDKSTITEFTEKRSILNPTRLDREITTDPKLAVPHSNDLNAIVRVDGFTNAEEPTQNPGYLKDQERLAEVLTLVSSFRNGNRDEPSLAAAAKIKQIRDHGIRKEATDALKRAMERDVGFSAAKRQNRMAFIESAGYGRVQKAALTRESSVETIL